MKTFVLPLSDSQADLVTVGGKGLSLAKLIRAGLPVPDGFHVTTEAYHHFINTNGLHPLILKALQKVDMTQPTTLETVSKNIRQLFIEASIPSEISEAICKAYNSLIPKYASSGETCFPAVAVRSSATAEDLPDASFAGQQDTYLNVRGGKAVLESIQKCWASLWTGRAIAYRMRQHISNENVALAVVIQLLVPAEAAGIMFTANPLSGKRNETVINASWGLGEAIVGGSVNPDTITVDTSTNRVVNRVTTEKQIMTVRTEDGTEEQSVPAAIKNKAVLSDEQASTLARYGTQIEKLYGLPMDIEWALANGQFAIVQARPITTLGETPLEWKRPDPKGLYMRTSVVDLMPDPLSPLFETLGLPAITNQMYSFGKDFTHMTPSLPDGYFTPINSYAYMNAHFSFQNWIWMLFGLLPAMPRLFSTTLSYWREKALPQYHKTLTDLELLKIEQMTYVELWEKIQLVVNAAARYINTLMISTMGSSAGSEGLLTKVYEKMVRQDGDPPATALLMGWDNLPIRSEKSLYDLSIFCRGNEQLMAYISKTCSQEIMEQINSNEVPEDIAAGEWQQFRQYFNEHLQNFGHMVFGLDFAKPLPRDHPEPMLEVIKMYLHDEGNNPHQRQKAAEERRIETGEKVLSRLKGIRRWIYLKALNWAQPLSEVREDALGNIGLGYPLLRQMLLTLGECFVKANIIQDANDIFWLKKSEIEKIIFTKEDQIVSDSMLEKVVQRKTFWQKAKKSVPPPMLPPRKKYLGIDTAVWLAEAEDDQTKTIIKGVATSPGRVTATARLLQGVEDFDRMRPGDVLVAGTTTPAWTPLFVMASAVVTDVGGPLSHGSIVAREYGIPAVMGTGVATRRIRDGQTITVDGDAGIVTLS